MGGVGREHGDDEVGELGRVSRVGRDGIVTVEDLQRRLRVEWVPG